MVLTMELNLARDKTGDEGKFHTRDHMLLISNPFFAKKTVWPFYIVVWHFAFQLYFTANRDSFDDGDVDGIY